MARNWTRRRHNDRVLATAARLMMSAAGLFVGVLAVRSLPALMRYLKLERM